MKNFIKTQLFLLIVLIINQGCYPVSHIIIGEKKTPINANEVKIYPDFPDEYEKIAMIEASSDFALKDMSLEITDQQKTMNGQILIPNGLIDTKPLMHHRVFLILRLMLLYQCLMALVSELYFHMYLQ